MGGEVDVEIGMVNKTATRLPEAMFVQLLPAAQGGSWAVNKLHFWIQPGEAVHGGTKNLHGCLDKGVRFDTDQQRMSIASLDAAVVAFGAPTAYPSVKRDPDISNYGASFVLWDNLWNCNYPFWWPFSAPAPEQYS